MVVRTWSPVVGGPFTVRSAVRSILRFDLARDPVALDPGLRAQNYVVVGVFSFAGGGGETIWRETMRSSRVCGWTLAASLIVFGIGLTVPPAASADPTDTDQTDSPAPGPGASAPTSFTAITTEETVPVATACKEFSAAMNYAASNYEDFAYATAGSGNFVNYGDPNVQDSGVVGRTGLREAIAAALSASGTPDLPPDVAAPMRSWSMNATRLLAIMAVHGGGDALNSAATDVNTDAHNVQLACAANGTRA